MRSTQNAAGEGVNHLKPKTTENNSSEPDRSSSRVMSRNNSLFRPYDPDIGNRTTVSNGDGTIQIDGHKLVGYVTIVKPHDGQCYLQPLPVLPRLTTSSAGIVNPAAFYGCSSLMPSVLPTHIPLRPSMMLSISPSISSYLSGSSLYVPHVRFENCCSTSTNY